MSTTPTPDWMQRRYAKSGNSEYAPPVPDPPDEWPVVACPRCGAGQEDLDGFGVIRCEACGYCRHPSYEGGVCTISGAAWEDPEVTPEQAEQIKEGGCGPVPEHREAQE